MEKDPINYTFDVPGIPKPEVLTAKFKKVTPTETTQLRILWSYSEDGKWTAPSFAKYAFAGKPALYKVYFIRSISSSIASLSEDPAVEFASEFLPAIHDVLFPQDLAKNPRLSGLPSRKQKVNHRSSKSSLWPVSQCAFGQRFNLTNWVPLVARPRVFLRAHA